MNQKRVLVTGGAGYVGSHCCVELLAADYQVIVLDNLTNSSNEALKRVEEISGKSVEFVEVDLASDEKTLDDVFKIHKIDAVIHFAGLKAVGESVKKPLLYYSNNINSTLNLLRCMEKYNVTNFIFSSSATVYGTPEKIPLDEKCKVGTGITNPYGKTKYFIEEIITDYVRANSTWCAVLLRYFNPVGAHSSGKIGEDPHGPPSNLMPYVSQVAVGRRKYLSVFGKDYDTVDGTGVRDYIHVVDLAKGHTAALQRKVFCADPQPGVYVYNLGRCEGTSVLQLLHEMEKACGHKIPHKIVGRREGDVGTNYADASLAEAELGWKTTRGLEEICADQWRWQENNPDGYSVAEKVDH